MSGKVTLEIMNNGAVYVDNYRISDRSTKPNGLVRPVKTIEIYKGAVLAALDLADVDLKKICPRSFQNATGHEFRLADQATGKGDIR